MSFTETQLIHRITTQSPTRTNGSTTTTFTLNSPLDQEDKGLLTATKLADSLFVKPINVASVVLNKSQVSCRLSALSGWVLRALSYFQNAHLAFVSFATNMNETIQKKVLSILPLFLYMSLLVLGVQFAVITVLLAQSLLPLGMWFLCICISTIGGIFCVTAEITEIDTSGGKRH